MAKPPHSSGPAQGNVTDLGADQDNAGPPEFTRAELEAGEKLFELPWSFLKGVVGLEHLPDPDRPEIAFAGRSNVGKSSLINALVRQKGLARTSSTPGRTQELNFFQTQSPLYLVDLPGYGYARAPKDKVDAWTSLVMDYLRGRARLARVYLLIDSRHGIKPVDLETMAILNTAAVSYQVVLTKSDKIKPPKRRALLAATSEALNTHAAAFPQVLVTSAEKNEGIAELRAAIAIVQSQQL